ncbi:hypothetical protein DV735_g2826, partial [Chaetothyriales sp. CBS 134920]
MAMSTSNYIDIDSLTSDEFSPYDHAAALIQRSNNPADPSIDLNTALSRALFDLQEIDSHIHTLTSRSALDILTYTRTQNEAAQRILDRVEEERGRLNASYARLQQEALGRYERASTAKLNSTRSWQVLQLGRQVQRVVVLARQFETAIADSGLGAGRVGREDHQALVRTTRLMLAFRELMASPQASDVGQVNLVKTIRGRIFEDGEARVLDFARRTVREFSMSSSAGSTAANGTFKGNEGNNSRFTSACHILYLLSPAPRIDGAKMAEPDFEPEYLLRALQSYLQTAITSSSAAIGRALAQLPLLERTTVEVSARCQNIVALETLLGRITAPTHPLLRPAVSKEQDLDVDDDGDDDADRNDDSAASEQRPGNFLHLLLQSLDTSSLPSYFWRSLASALNTRVQEILTRGGVSARMLRSQKEVVRQEIRQCVMRGARAPQIGADGSTRATEESAQNWEREAAVMVGSVMAPLGR